MSNSLSDEHILIPNHVNAWIDRIGNMVFISDDCGGEMNPEYYRAAVFNHDVFNGRVEAATWWM